MPNIQKSQNQKRQQVFVAIFSFLVIVSFVAVLARVYIRGDYQLSSEVSCDPAEESCFIRQCTEDCDPNEPYEYYKHRTLAAAFASTCNPSRGECPDILCSQIPTCVEELCTEENLPEGEWCNDPAAYRDSMRTKNTEEKNNDGAIPSNE